MSGPGGPPPPISERAVVVTQIFYGVTIPLVVLATATLGYRLARMKGRSNLWSDVCITIGYILTLAACGLYIPQAFLTPGEKSPAALLEGQKGSFLSIPIWGMAMAFIKVSIGLTLLRIDTSLFFRIFVWGNIALAASYGFGNLWFILFSCQPLSAAWGDFADPESATCLPPSAIKIASVTGAVVSVTTDVFLSLAPIQFLWNLKRPLRERIVLGCLMAMGLFAGISSIIKNLIIADFGKPGLDAWAMNISISTWTSLEMLLGVIAACTPFCRPVFERCFSAMGVSISKSKTGGSGVTPGYGHHGVASSGYQRANERDAFRSKNTTISTSTKQLDRSESDEDLVGGRNHSSVAIEMQPQAPTHPGMIRKQTDIHVHTVQGDDSDGPDQKKYYLAV
ncbi:hypothetical protein V8F33_011686 [Rhypophila sp. PSN 637]